jgi:hypothetical protein
VNKIIKKSFCVDLAFNVFGRDDFARSTGLAHGVMLAMQCSQLRLSDASTEAGGSPEMDVASAVQSGFKRETIERKETMKNLFKNSIKVLCPILLAVMASTQNPVFASIPNAGVKLSAEQRDRLRYRLENNSNELELLVLNQGSDKSDLARQKRDVEGLQVYQRIPFKDEIDSLSKQMKSSAEDQNLKLMNLKVIGRSAAPAKKIPAEVKTDEKFRLTEDQLVEKIQLEAQVTGTKEQVKAWVDSWQEQQMRLVEPKGGYGSYPITPTKSSDGKSAWIVKAQTFKFKEVQYPKLLPRDPLEVLPAEARKNPEAFAAAEPLLWKLIQKSKALTPKAAPMYEAKREFMLNQARMDFFLSKALPTNDRNASHRHGSPVHPRGTQRAGVARPTGE